MNDFPKLRNRLRKTNLCREGRLNYGSDHAQLHEHTGIQLKSRNRNYTTTESSFDSMTVVSRNIYPSLAPNSSKLLRPNLTFPPKKLCFTASPANSLISSLCFFKLPVFTPPSTTQPLVTDPTPAVGLMAWIESPNSVTHLCVFHVSISGLDDSIASI